MSEKIELDRGHETDVVYSPVCALCRHLDDVERRTCAAFPLRIPDAIWRGRNDHRQPFPGDHGIQFAPIER